MPCSGYIKNFVLEDFGLKIYHSGNIIVYKKKNMVLQYRFHILL